MLTTIVMLFLVACSDATFTTDPADDPSVIYHDDFSPETAGLWLVEQDDLGSTNLNGEQLVISVLSPNTVQYTTLQEPEFSDFKLEIDATLVEGASNSTYGVLFRIQDTGEFYRFELMSDGHYIVERHDGNNVWSRLVDDWTYSDVVLAGPNTNRLRIEAKGPNMLFFANGEFLQEVIDTSLSSGNIGLDAGTFGTDLTLVSFDNLVLSKP